MSTVLGTNLNSLFARRELSGVQQGLSASVERLSSGLRINRAKDDVAGLGISEVLRSQVTAINQGIRNANDAISVVQAAEGSLTEASSILVRMKELATQARNASLSRTQRQFITDELSNLRKEINAIAERTTFNDLSLLKNALRTEPLQAQLGANNLQAGSILANGLRVTDVAVAGANAGNYRLTTGVVDEIMTPLSYVTAKSDPTVGKIPNPEPEQFLNNDFENSSEVTTTTVSVQVNGSAGVTTSALKKSIPGWDVYLHQVKLGTTEIGGFTSPSVTNNAGTTPPNGDENTPTSATGWSVSFTTSVAAQGNSAVLNSSPMTTLAGFDVVHGPYMISQSTVSLIEDDVISFKWKAEFVGDDYDVYGYLLNTTNGTTIELLKGSDTSTPGVAAGAFATATTTIAPGAEGIYKFVFVAGTYDKSGFRGAGAKLHIDDVSVAFASRPGVTQVYAGGSKTDRTLTISGEWEPGDEIDYTVKGNTSTVAELTYVVTAENFTANNDGTGGAIDPDSDLARQNIASSIAEQYASLTNVTPVATTSSGIVTFSGASVTITAEQLNRPLLNRTITFANDDIASGNRITLAIGEKNYTVIAGTDMTAAEVANAFKSMVLADYPGSATVSANTLTLQPGSQTSNTDIAVSVARAEQVLPAEDPASFVSDVGGSSNISRSIVINDLDVIAGRQFVLTIGNPESSTQYAVVAGTGDTATSIAQKLENLLDDNLGSAAGSSAGSTVSGNVVTLTAASGLGMSRISLDVYETLAGKSAVAVSEVNARTRDDRARTLTINRSDVIAGATFSVAIGDKEYSITMDSSDTAESVAKQLIGLIEADYPNTDSTTRLTRSGNRLTLTADARVGLDDISISLKKLSDPNALTLTALEDTGRAGASQTVYLNRIGTGDTAVARFEELGVSINLVNERSSAFDRKSNFINTQMVNNLQIGSPGADRAVFQVGVNSRSDYTAAAFKDIRLTGFNQNSGAGKLVFDRLAASLDEVIRGRELLLQDSQFSTLENLIEDAITTLNGFRSDLGSQQNRLEFAMSSLQTQSSQLALSKSQIVDTDYAAETARLTRMQIGQQAATAMLAQANQLPNVILSLLG